MSGNTNRINWETLRVLAGPFTGVYQAVGGPFLNPSYICKMVNNSNVLLTVSIDGINDIDVLPPNSFWLYDETKNTVFNLPALPKHTQIFVKGVGGAGSVYVVTQYIV